MIDDIDLPSQQGYCIWCGSEIRPTAWGLDKKDIVWEKCHKYLCKGAIIQVVTDWDGFVIEPERESKRYIYSRKLR